LRGGAVAADTSGVPVAVVGPFAELDAELRRAGYRPQRPATAIAVEDELVCSLHACPACRTAGLDYRPYRRPAQPGERSGYRVLAVCPGCGRAEEY
jgi:hypothetical protein